MNEPSEQSKRIDHEAAAWVVKHERGLADSEQDAFSQWLAADAAHGRSFARQRHNWRLLDQLAEWRPEHGARPNPDLLAPRARAAISANPRWLGLAAAAALVIGGLAWQHASLRDVPVAPVEQRLLDDGTVIDLNHGATISVDYSPAERRVVLSRGEAHFTVASNPSRPFVVRANGVEVTAVGTAFNVRVDRAEVKVLVTEGRVRVASPSAERSPGPSPEAPTVRAGELAVVPLEHGPGAPRVMAVTPAEIQRLLAWQPRMLDFTGTRLPDIVAEFNRCNRIQVVITDPALESLRLSVSFRSDNVEGFVRLLEGAFNVRVEHSNDVITLRRAP